jgi:hypothetical protein
VSFRSLQSEGEVSIGNPTVIYTPSYTLTKTNPSFVTCILDAPKPSPDALLYAEAEAPITVFNPELVDIV